MYLIPLINDVFLIPILKKKCSGGELLGIICFFNFLLKATCFQILDNLFIVNLFLILKKNSLNRKN